jgi:hypothetical protein
VIARRAWLVRWWILLCVDCISLPVSAWSQAQLTEFMAANSRTLKDDFSQFEDWIEVYNPGAVTVDLAGWALTDNADNLFKWRFPATNLPPKSYLVVFASNRDRRIPGLTLHANFRLDALGEYLALVRPDGQIATEYAPAYPPQMTDVSFGQNLRSTASLVIDTNATGRVLVPQDSTWELVWASEEFSDLAWRPATNGIGFQAGSTADPNSVSSLVLADHPTGYWRLGETNGGLSLNFGMAADKANGSWLGGITAGVAGPRPPGFAGFETNNTSARFNGIDGRIEVPFLPELNPAGPFTVEAWVNPARAGGATAWAVSSLNVDGGRPGYALAQDYSAKNQWEFRLGDNSGYIAMAYGGTVEPNRWQYLTGVYDGTSAHLYVNGALVAEAGLSRPLEPNPSQKFIVGGRIDAANPYYFAGDLDEVAVYPRALGADEIAARFDAAWHGVGSRLDTSYASLINTDLQADLLGLNSTAYLRLPFAITNAAAIEQLILRVKYNDGFAAYLNGALVASNNVPGPLAWNSTALNYRSSRDAIQFETFDLSRFASILHQGTNLLGLQGLNRSDTNSDFLLLVELEAVGTANDQSQSRFCSAPTPRGPNGTGTRDLGPIIISVDHTPHLPSTNDSLTISCRVEPAFALVTNVTLHWRVMFDVLSTVTMFDDGAHGDGEAGDLVYGAVIPNQIDGNWTFTAGQMVRWFVTAEDSLGRSSRWPLFEAPRDSAEYLGTVIQPDYVTSKLPVFHLFAPTNVLQPGPNTQQKGADSEQGGRVALYYDGELYDNVYLELRGNTSAGLNKKAHRLEFNREQPFRHPGPGGRVRKSSLLAEHLDPAYLRQHLCFWLLNLMGVPSPFDYPVRLQLNGEFYQLAFHSDVLGEAQLERLGYDSSGALYKCVGQVDPQFNSTGGFQKWLPQTNLTDRSDYLKLANGINESKPLSTRRTSVFDYLDVAQVINYLAGARFCAENDDVWANMCLYRDTYGDGLWRVVPFDMNASWGQLYGGSSPLTATNDYSKSHPLYGGSQIQEGGHSAWNRLYDVIIALPETRSMLLRRERTLLDSWVLHPGTAPDQLIIENYVRHMTNLILIEAQLDRQKWGYSPWAPSKSFTAAINDLLVQFVGPRRYHWHVTHSVTNTAKPVGLGNTYNAGIPLSQPPEAVIEIAYCDFSPESGNQEEEFICLTNRNSYAVDVSGWKLGGDVSFTLKPGTVIPSNCACYLSPNAAAFRARPQEPHGGMGLFVQGNYHGRLDARGGSLFLADVSGRLVFSSSFVGSPSLAQQFLRITEIMYHPSSEPGRTNATQDFEYLELQNISTNHTLELSGVKFTQGITLQFGQGMLARLEPRQTCVVVRDTNAFALRYGTNLTVAAQYQGTLDNAGETIRLADGAGDTILEFAFDPDWYPAANGGGYSLVIVNEFAPWNTWGLEPSWRLSSRRLGSPGMAEPAPPVLHCVAIDTFHLEISTLSSLGARYALEHAANLDASDWTLLPPVLSGSGGVITFLDSIDPKATRFYRLRVYYGD